MSSNIKTPAASTVQAGSHGSDAPAAEKHLSGTQRVIGGLFALALLGLCAGTWLAPDLLSFAQEVDVSGRGGRRIVNLINLLWSRPAGTIAGLLGLFIAFGVIAGGNKTQARG
jgi:hypothetical protein